MDQRTLDGFATLFWGQTNAYFDCTNMRTVWRKLSSQTFLDHIEGKQELGIYCTNDLSRCHWGCIDIDDARSLLAYQLALTIRNEFEENGITAWIETSRSKGFHLWVFLQTPMPAHLVRECQLGLLSRIGVEKIEVNPKQETLYSLPAPKTSPPNRTFGIGNLVRLPYTGAMLPERVHYNVQQTNPGRQVVLDRQGQPLELSTFVSAALDTRTTQRELELLAGQHRPTQREEVPVGPHPSTGSPSNQEAWAIWNGERTVQKGERDNQFYTLAKLLHSHDKLYQEALQVVTKVYHEQLEDIDGFSLEQAQTKVRNVYGR